MRRFLGAVAAFLVATLLPLEAISAPPAKLLGVTIERSGEETKVTIAATAPFRYSVTSSPVRILLTLEGVTASPALLPVARGAIKKVDVTLLANHSLRLTLHFYSPLELYKEQVDGPILLLTLGPPRPQLNRPAPLSQKPPAKAPEPSKPSHPARQSPSGAPVPIPPATLRKDTPPPVERVALEVYEGTGTLLVVPDLLRVAVSNPAIIGVVPISGQEVLVNGKQAGSTTLFLWQGKGGLRVYDVTVRRRNDHLAGIREILKTIVPEGSVDVLIMNDPAGGSQGSGTQGSLVILLVGKVPSQRDLERIEDAARVFGGKVVSLIEVARQVQVKLQVLVVELDRTAGRDLGILWGEGHIQPGGSPLPGLFTFQVLTQPVLQASGLDGLLAKLQVLAREGRAKLLAQPSLVVMAGKEANLLLGGEVPVPVQTQGTVSIMFKEFGVKLRAKPEVRKDGQVLLDLTPEVSSLDFANGIRLESFVVPALKTRKVATIVMLSPGQTLAIGGLLQHEESEVIQKFPFLGDLPILGPLFRSTTFQRRESELVLLVTPEVVDVTAGGK
ncbi:MAG: pilus assembly protein N-terminal domain-containing protein [Armatimonadota bacterium]|nr:pilus assembly protein N-terminal domain-containing protein [Armatimonadota bacterium]MDR5703211.1 pilus assembly protein N-terminal domain-containing protein [Armatimonadota bacterium]